MILIPFSVASLQSSTPLPVGVIEPWKWENRTIPVTGSLGPTGGSIDLAVVEAMRQHGIVGCGVAVVKGDQIVYAKGFGYAELPKTPFASTTASRCGSVAKPITAMCALLLADGGKLDLDAPILPILKRGGIVPVATRGKPFDERINRIKVRDLLDHTSGFTGGTTYTAWRTDSNVAEEMKLDHPATSADVVRHALGNSSLISEPGTAFHYSNANFVILARVVAICAQMPFNEYLTKVAMPKFGVGVDEIFVSRNQLGPEDRGRTEAAYYQTSDERYVSFLPGDLAKGRVFGEAYRGYATEASDGAGGIAASAVGVAKIVANLNSSRPVLSAWAMRQILTPPAYRLKEPGFDVTKGFYSKGLDVRYSGGRPWFAHGGMTIHAGGVIGHNAGYQFVVVSNWNNSKGPFVDSIMDHAVAGAVGEP